MKQTPCKETHESFNCSGSCTTNIGKREHCKECYHGEIAVAQLYNGKIYRFSFNPIFGPLFLDRNGDDLKRQPMSPGSPRWKAFDLWYNKKESQ